MIRLDDIVVDYGGSRPALALPRFTVAAGEFVTVIGSNGAGKSTLLRLISGAVRPARGHVVVGDRDVTALPAHRRAPLVGQVFQDPLAGSCAALSIEENFAVAARRTGRRSLRLAVGPTLRERARALLAEAGLGLEQRLAEPVVNLSGGQRQVLALAMALVAPSPVLLLDEHTAALDPKTAEVVLTATERFVQAARPTVLMVTHSMQQALAHGTRTVMLDDGQIALDLDADHRRGLTPADLIALFTARRGQAALTDRMLLSA